MTAEEQPPATEQKAVEPQKKPPTLEEILSKMQADSFENKKAIDLLAQAVVKLNEKIEALPKGGASGGEATDILKVMKGLAEGEKSSIEGLVKEAEGMAKLAENLDRFRFRGMGIGEALLMKAGMRAALPRYMTKHELTRYEKALGLSALLEEEGEHEHVSE